MGEPRTRPGARLGDGGGETRGGGPACGLPGAAPPRPSPPQPAPAARPGRPARPPHFLRPPALTSFSSRLQLPPPPAPPRRGGLQVRPGAGRRGRGRGVGTPASRRQSTGPDPGSSLARGRGREVLGSLQVGRARPGGAGTRRLGAAGGSGRVDSCTVNGCTSSREPTRTPEIGGLPLREKSL